VEDGGLKEGIVEEVNGIRWRTICNIHSFIRDLIGRLTIPVID
jgi:hypothetical protein